MENPIRLIIRIWQMLFSPKKAWLQIKEEDHSPTQLLYKYGLFLAAIDPTLQLAARISHEPFPSYLLTEVIMGYGGALFFLVFWALLNLFVLIPDSKDADKAFQLSVNSRIPVYISDIFCFAIFRSNSNLWELIFWIREVALVYSVYLIWLGTSALYPTRGKALTVRFLLGWLPLYLFFSHFFQIILYFNLFSVDPG